MRGGGAALLALQELLLVSSAAPVLSPADMLAPTQLLPFLRQPDGGFMLNAPNATVELYTGMRRRRANCSSSRDNGSCRS